MHVCLEIGRDFKRAVVKMGVTKKGSWASCFLVQKLKVSLGCLEFESLVFVEAPSSCCWILTPQYGGHVFHAGGGSDRGLHLCIHLGLTDYRTFTGTNLSHLWERFLIPSEDDSVLCQHTSSPLGNGAVVETIDNKILVLKRSNNVGEFPGYFVFPGGHPEAPTASSAPEQMNSASPDTNGDNGVNED